jgi:molybdopterin-containing oxidoreductase family membrane subunit
MMGINLVIPQLFWIRRIRRSLVVTFLLALFINVGMWLERFVIVVTSISRDYLPGSWSEYIPTRTEVFLYIGTFGFFFMFFLLFIRIFPVVSIHEVKAYAINK